MLQRIVLPDGAVVYRAPLLVELGVPHAFTTRASGPGAGEPEPEASLWCALAGAEGDAEPFDVRQVHGREVVVVTSEERAGTCAADALVTERPDRLLAIRTADCVPLLLARDDGERVAAVHAGWRGLVAGVIPRALEALGAGEHVAAIGAAICARCFEVGDEVVRAFERAELGAAVVPGVEGARARVDLVAAASLQLERGGVRRIEGTDRCTYEHADELWSHRRDVTHGGRETTGRQLALVAPRYEPR